MLRSAKVQKSTKLEKANSMLRAAAAHLEQPVPLTRKQRALLPKSNLSSAPQVKAKKTSYAQVRTQTTAMASKVAAESNSSCSRRLMRLTSKTNGACMHPAQFYCTKKLRSCAGTRLMWFLTKEVLCMAAKPLVSECISGNSVVFANKPCTQMPALTLLQGLARRLR